MRKAYTRPEVQSAIEDEITKSDCGVSSILLINVLDILPVDRLASVYNQLFPENIEPRKDFASDEVFLAHNLWTQVASEFPDWEIGDIKIPEDWEELSWHNDICPSWHVPDTDLRIWIDYVNPGDREAGLERFSVAREDEGGGELEGLFSTDYWGDVLKFVDMYKVPAYQVFGFAVIADTEKGEIFMQQVYKGEGIGFDKAIESGSLYELVSKGLPEHQYLFNLFRTTGIE